MPDVDVKKPIPRRRKADDRFTSVFQQVIMASSAITVIYGQAELLGEPWRHIITVFGTLILMGVAIWMKVT